MGEPHLLKRTLLSWQRPPHHAWDLWTGFRQSTR